MTAIGSLTRKSFPQGKDPDGFLPYILKQGKERTTLSLQQLRDAFPSNQIDEEVKLSLACDSLSGRHYKTTIHIREGLDSELVVRKILPVTDGES